MSGFALSAAAVFLCGAIYEGAGIMWVHCAERNHAVWTGIISALQATCSLVGIGASLNDHAYAPFYVAGYFFGPWATVLVKRRRMKRSRDSSI
jgi:hypothetical protein